MHTVMVVAGGLVLLALFVLIGRFFGDTSSAIGTAVKLFVPVWLAAALVNMWGGVARAGYSLAAEASVFVLVFALPVLAGLFIWWKFS